MTGLHNQRIQSVFIWTLVQYEIAGETISSIIQVTTSAQPAADQETVWEEEVESVNKKVESRRLNLFKKVMERSCLHLALVISRFKIRRLLVICMPSSIPLQKGQGYTSLKFVFVSGVVGVTDNVTLLVGSTLIPVVSVVGGKYAKQIHERLHVGAGAEVFFLPFASAFDNGSPTAPLSIGFVSATYGDLNSHVTVATGVAYEQLFSDGRINHMVAYRRLSDRLAVVTENWLLVNLDIMADGRSPYTASINSLAFRFIGNRSDDYNVLGQTISSRLSTSNGRLWSGVFEHQ